MTLVSADGTVKAVSVPPEVRDGTGSAETFTFYDPVTGHYLVYTYARRDPRKVWEFDPGSEEWAMALDLRAGDMNYPPYHGHLIASVPELGGILWMHRSDYNDNQHQRLYRHTRF